MSEQAFANPQRQSLVAILQIIYKTYVVLIKQAWPILIALFVGSSRGSFGEKITIAIAATAVLSMILSIIRFWRFSFYVEGKDLIVQKGILFRKKIVLPLKRIQSINIEQNLLHRVTGVVGMKVDTAGSSEEEISFSALGHTKAKELRSLLLSESKSASPTNDGTTGEEDSSPSIDRYVVHEVPLPNLLMIGLTENHIRSGWLIVGFGFWLFSELEGVGIETEEYLPSYQEIATLVAYLITAFVIASVFISLVRTLFRFFNLRFVREADGFVLESGLFTRRSTSAKDNKIQTIGWRDNLLRKTVGLHHLSIRQAGLQAINSKAKLTIAGIRSDGIDTILKNIYSKIPGHNTSYQRVDIRWRNRRLLLITLPMMALTGLLVYTQSYVLAVIVALTWAFWVVATIRAYTKLGYSIDDEYLLLSGGSWGDSRTIVPIYKLQHVGMSSTPYQRRHQLASIELKTAADKHTIPYIDREQALDLHGQLLYQLETNEKDWI